MNNGAFGDARTAHHPRGTGGALAEDVDAAADGITEHGNPMIRVQIDEILVLVKMLLQIGKQQPECAIRLPHLLQILLLIDAEIGQTDTRYIGVMREEPFCQRQVCLNGGIALEPACIVRMYVQQIEEEELIGLVKCIDVAEDGVHADRRVQCPSGGDDTVESAQQTVCDSLCRRHGGSAVVAEAFHPLCDGRHTERQFVSDAQIKYIGMVRIVSGLDGGVGGQGILRARELLVKDRSAREETHDVRQMRLCIGACDGP